VGEIDFENFYEVGIIRDSDGKDYSIRIEKGLSQSREREILEKMALGKLSIRGHVVYPEDQDLGA
jgi:hypothetical protein